MVLVHRSRRGPTHRKGAASHLRPGRRKAGHEQARSRHYSARHGARAGRGHSKATSLPGMEPVADAVLSSRPPRRTHPSSAPPPSPPPGEPAHRLARRPMSATLPAPSDAEVGMAQKTWEISGGGDALRELPPAPACLHEERDPGGRVRASGRYLTVRHGSGHVGVEDRLPSPARQPPDHGHESLPDHRGDEPGAHRDSQRAPTRRPPAPAAGLTRDER